LQHLVSDFCQLENPKPKQLKLAGHHRHIGVEAFDDGATPETIVQMYSTLKLADVYAAIAYYLRHRQEIRDYLAERERRGEVIWQCIQAQHPEISEIRRRLMDRGSITGSANAPAAE
jgi:hypothetical protein